MKRIIFNLKKEWYDRITSGEPEPETGKPKLIEYREMSSHWWRRLVKGPFWTNDYMIPKDWYAVFRLGYSRKYPDIIRRIVRIDIGTCPYKGWNGEYFRIYFEEVAR